MRLQSLIVFIALLFVFAFQARAQSVKLLTLDQLDKRVQQGKDTVYVVNFWATWCVPCLEELPYFEKLNQTLSGQKAKVLLVSLDFKSKLASDVRPMAKKLQLKNEVFLLNELSQQTYMDRIDKNWSGALPATLFINTAKNKRSFFEKEFTYTELLETYHLNQ